MKALSVFGVMLLGLVSVAGTLLFFYQRTLIYPAPDMTVPKELPPGVEKIELTNSYGYLIHGAEGKSTQKPTLLALIALYNSKFKLFCQTQEECVISTSLSLLLVLESSSFKSNYTFYSQS